ncbi:MAG: LPS-assembly protein LptD, partial [Paludibacteraceae bacterium]|nr:LPS-assembly protein LptD [Paludibacteraceae bacterium]
MNISFCLQAKNLNPSPSDTLQALPDSVLTTNDSLTVSVPRENPNKIDAEIIYSASDSIVFYGNGTGFLHGKGDVKYKNITLQADFIRVKMDSSLIYARGTTDSLGNKIGEPVFSEGEATYYSKELTYNLQSKKGYIRNAVTQQGEGYVISDKTKKLDDNILLIADGKYTTCDKHDNPDFYLYLTKGKIKPGDYIVTGPAYLVLADVPLPIAVPFGFFPFTDKYSSGILMPNYADELNRGFGLTNGGYYFALSDYADLELLGDIYTKGTWALTANSRYIKKYKYNGNFSFSYRVDVTGEKDLPDYSKATNMNIRWTHSQDQKANPYFTFTSSVNFSTSGYNRSNINSYFNPNLNSENTKGSSISFTKRFPSQSNLSLSGSMLINQRTKDSTISLTLPTLNIAVSRFSPFKRKNAVGNERWYEKIYMSYSGTFANSIDTKESLLLSSSLSKDWRNGMRHSIPVSATFNLFKYINISPSFNYTERWYLRSVDKNWDSDKQKEITDTVSGFNRVYDFNMGVSASTKLYGFFIPIRSIFG